MRKKHREVMIAAGLWVLFVLCLVYVAVLLFPKQMYHVRCEALKAVNRGVRGSIVRMSEEMLPVFPFVLEYTVRPENGSEKVPYQSYEEYLKAVYENELSILDEQVRDKTEGMAEISEKMEISQEETAAVSTVMTDRLERYRSMSQRGGWSFDEILQFDTLLNRLYVVSEGTSITANELNPQRLLSYNLSIKPKDGYDILIYHTHSQEAFADSVPGNVSQTVVGMGELLKEQLEGYGYSVLHHKGIYDMTDGKLDRDPAYTKALPVISSIIEAYPEIEVIIDLHRDGVREDMHLVQEINGKPTARIMYFNGLCRSETGEREDISNPYREENMALSLQLALTTMTDYPGLTRCIYLRSSRYNLHLRGKSALIEVGAQTNTVEEVSNAIPVLADVINKVLTN